MVKMRKLRKGMFLIGTVMIAGSLILSGCGASKSTVGTTPTPVAKDKVIRTTASDTPNIDPGVGNDFSSSMALLNLYDTLVFPNPDGSIKPLLATDWVASPDGLTYTFNLRKGVKFHNGDELTADDIVFSMNRMLTMGEGFSYLFTDVVSQAKALDTHKVEFKLKKTFGPFLATLVRLYVVNGDQVLTNKATGSYGDKGDYGKAWLATNDAGSGPFMVKEMKKQQHLNATKFPEYWGGWDKDAPDNIQIVGTTESATVRTMISNNQLEISDQWQTEEALKALDQMPGVAVDASFSGTILNIMLNTKKAPTDDIHFRKALAYAFDYQTVIDKLFPGSMKAKGPVPFNLPGFNDQLPQYGRNLELAKAELAKSKYAGQLDKYPVELAWIAEVPDEEKIAMLFQANAGELGITVKVQKTPWLSFVDQVATKEKTPHASTVFVASSYNEAGSMLFSRYHSKSNGTWEQGEWLMDKEMDKSIDAAISTVDAPARLNKYKEIQKTIVDLCPTIWVFDQAEKRAFREDLIIWPGHELVKNGKPISSVMGYNFYFHDFKVIPAK